VSPVDSPRAGKARSDAARSALDVLLTDATDSSRARFAPVGATARLAAAVLSNPRGMAGRAKVLSAELGRVAMGASQFDIARGDKRFVDPAWEESWWFRRLLQAYLAVGETTDGIINDAGLEAQDERRVRFVIDVLYGAASPTNFPWSNPAAIKAALDSGGASFVRGARNLVRDISRAPRLPAMSDPSYFTVGEDLAVTPGAVVLRTELFELLHYKPQTAQVREVPVLLVPPMINKYYVLDLAPGRSLAEHLVAEGQQVFVISWRNPDERHRNLGLDNYGAAILEATEAVSKIARSEGVHLAGFCSGGLAAAAVAGHLEAIGESDRIASLSLVVCILDHARAGVATALLSREAAAMAVADSARKGYVDGRALAGVFAWLRPNDLIWSYVANNYLLGKPPPQFDVLYWNADTTRLAAGLHRDFIKIALENAIARPGSWRLLDQPVDLSRVQADTYVVGGSTDHITPWENCFASTRLVGGESRFILSTSGHVQALVNPPGNPKASFRVGASGATDPQTWLESSAVHGGTWWSDWAAWLGDRSGALRSAPRSLGRRPYKVLEPAPGAYVLGT
jgi:polyhydroxyalkanoate synthase